MAITNIHGSNGSYKTASAVIYHIAPAILEGRVVVTNIRGCTLDKFYDVYGDKVPDTADIINVETAETPQGQKNKALIRAFWKWVPLNALLVFDEAGVLFPKAWRQADIDKLNLTDISDAPFQPGDEERPGNYIDALEMQRHYGWDILLTSPSIKGIRDDIKNTTELAIRQRNAALIGVKGRFKAVEHDPSNNGTSPSHELSSKLIKIDKTAFKLYDSTTENAAAKDTANARSFGSPRLFLVLGMLSMALWYGYTNFKTDSKLLSNYSEVQPQVTSAGSPPPQKNSSTPVTNANSPRANEVVRDNNLHVIAGLPVTRLYITGHINMMYMFEIHTYDLTQPNDPLVELTYNTKELKAMGYSVSPRSPCFALIKDNYSGHVHRAYCKPSKVDDDDKENDKFDESQLAQVTQA